MSSLESALVLFLIALAVVVRPVNIAASASANAARLYAGRAQSKVLQCKNRIYADASA